jgi:hypothetical protein
MLDASARCDAMRVILSPPIHSHLPVAPKTAVQEGTGWGAKVSDAVVLQAVGVHDLCGLSGPGPGPAHLKSSADGRASELRQQRNGLGASVAGRTERKQGGSE